MPNKTEVVSAVPANETVLNLDLMLEVPAILDALVQQLDRMVKEPEPERYFGLWRTNAVDVLLACLPRTVPMWKMVSGNEMDHDALRPYVKVAIADHKKFLQDLAKDIRQRGQVHTGRK